MKGKAAGLAAILINYVEANQETRFLQSFSGTVNSTIQTSRECTADCIDRGDVFCRAFTNYTEGQCCDKSDF